MEYFGNKHHQYWSAGDNTCKSLGRPRSHEACNIIPKLNNIEMKDICIGYASRSIFWITNDNEIYVNGRNHLKQLGGDTDSVDEYSGP